MYPWQNYYVYYSDGLKNKDIRKSIGKNGTGKIKFGAARYTFTKLTRSSTSFKILYTLYKKGPKTRQDFVKYGYITPYNNQSLFQALHTAKLVDYNPATHCWYLGRNYDIILRDFNVIK